MQQSRRNFLKLTGGSLAAVTLGAWACKTPASAQTASIPTFGLQLYTLREDMPRDPRGVLKQVAAMGYKQLESYEPKELGMFWGMGAAGMKKYLDELGTTMVASHCEIDKDFERKAADAASIGMKYLICPWKGPQKSLSDFKRFAADFNVKGEICRKNGIRFAYHNHDYSFKPLEGRLPQDVMMEETDPKLVDFEMDIYWVVTAGEDASAWFKKYNNRFRLCHIKDREKNGTGGNASCILGQGSIDYPAILKKAKEHGMEYFIVEQEKYEGTTPLKAVAANAEYMKTLKF